MENIIFKMSRLSFLAVGMLALVACNKELSDKGQDFAGEGNISVTVDVDIEGMKSAVVQTTATKSVLYGDILCEVEQFSCGTADRPSTKTDSESIGIDDPSTVSNTIIKNLLILQFDGATTNNDAILQTAVYINDYQNDSHTIKLVGASTKQTIVYLANSFISDPRFQPGRLTLGTFKTFKFGPLYSLADVVALNPYRPYEGDNSFPNNGYYYQRLSGIQEINQLESSSDLTTCTLKHNLCKIQLNVKNLTAASAYPVKLNYVDVDNVPGCVYMLTANSDYGEKPTSEDMIEYGTFAHTNVASFTDGSAKESDSVGENFTLYLPGNQRGTSSSTNPQDKNAAAPTGSSVVKIRGTYHDSVSS